MPSLLPKMSHIRLEDSQYCELMYQLLDIMVDGNQHDAHPKHFCFNCYISMLLSQERKDARTLYNFQIVYVTWKAHDSDPSL